MAITKEQFDAAYNKYGPSKFLKFVYTYYNVKMKRPGKPLAWGTIVAVIAFFIATIGMIVFDQLGMKPVAIGFVWGYIPFGALLISLPAFLLNKARIKKIIKILGVTPIEYNKLVDRFYPDGL